MGIQVSPFGQPNGKLHEFSLGSPGNQVIFYDYGDLAHMGFLMQHRITGLSSTIEMAVEVSCGGSLGIWTSINDDGSNFLYGANGDYNIKSNGMDSPGKYFRVRYVSGAGSIQGEIWFV